MKPTETEKKPEKNFKPRVEPIAAAHIVDAWKMYEKYLSECKVSYPDLSEESPDAIRSNLFQSICTPGFFGLMLKVGRRPVGQIMGMVIDRHYGKPNKFIFILCAYVDPAFRKRGNFSILSKEFFNRLKGFGIHHWEMDVSDSMDLSKQKSREMKKLVSRYGGKC